MRGTCGAAPTSQQPALRSRQQREATPSAVQPAGEVTEGSLTDKMIQQHPLFLSINPLQPSWLQPLQPWVQPQPSLAAHKTRRSELCLLQPLALSPAWGQQEGATGGAKQHNDNFSLCRHELRGGKLTLLSLQCSPLPPK